MRGRGYGVAPSPEEGDALIHDLLFADAMTTIIRLTFTRTQTRVDAYRFWFDNFPENVRKRLIRAWQEPGRDPQGALAGFFVLSVCRSLKWRTPSSRLQPPRGYGMNPDAIYHTPDLPPGRITTPWRFTAG